MIEQMALLGFAWGIGIWGLWMGYLMVWCPTFIKNIIMSRKIYIIACDLIVTYFGSKLISSSSGSIAAGIGTFVLLMACFTSSSIIIQIAKRKKNLYTVKVPERKRGKKCLSSVDHALSSWSSSLT